MSEKDKLEEYLMNGIKGTPEIKKEEKKKYLGEFSERVILAVEIAKLHEDECLKQINDAVEKNQSIDKIIVNSVLKNTIRIQCMKMAKNHDRDFKLVEGDTSIGIVLASNTAL
ncbi:MAG: YueI family protein [Clostridia bacterium]|nr:YueI family protein [Clostridia bacterium]